MTEKKIGYARAATENEIAEQVTALKAAGCAEVFTDSKKVSAPLSRPGLKAALRTLQPGDTLVVLTINRLSRSMADNLQVIEGIMSRGIEFEAIDEPEEAISLQDRINYAPDPSRTSPFIRYSAFRIGQFLVRRSRLREIA